MALLFTLSKLVTLLGCGWSTPCAIAFVSRDLLQWLQGVRTKTTI